MNDRVDQLIDCVIALGHENRGGKKLLEEMVHYVEFLELHSESKEEEIYWRDRKDDIRTAIQEWD